MSRTRKKKQTQCALCGAAAKTVGQYEPSQEENERWGFAAIPLSLCADCEALPNRGTLLSARLGFATQETERVQ